MSATPPQRLSLIAEPRSALAHGLEAARLREPSQDELRALERDLAAVLGGAALLGTGAATAKGGSMAAGAASAWLSTAAMKVTAVVVLAAAGGTAGGVAWRRHALGREGTAVVAARHDDPQARGPAASAAGEAPTWPASVAFPMQSSRSEAQPTQATTPPPSTPPAPASSSPGLAERLPLPRRAGALRTRPGEAAVAAVGARPRARDALTREASSLRDELSLIARAQQALPANPRGALAFAEEHERRFGDALLAQEREVIAIAALLKLGRTVEGRARAERFVRRFPESAHMARVRRLAAAAERTP